ncbi:putative radical SAM enzyme, TIGR03279 family [Caminicella sporogenes DSM 14501]|uniref:Putative radical SAM enzyme, TIGR03279 family n=1 Tax=Caminicella sporogenes DSM 14501 TaxID=1121266 RepID=A0A1M6L2E0_9FIRM|nr:DUF512 domain-containing protein [Caminicella sporogenes]RKD27683.1 Fe-S oxidoreductase [Caminicella sporogenes]SHJ65455.1 putative radical SAM enzyme, TIGR03279 family [Caminicella sporogenes DSM 14501]
MNKFHNKNIIANIVKGSIAEEIGIEPGDVLHSINGREINDIIDYLYHTADEYLEVEIEKENGEIWILEIEKEYDEDLGIIFSNPILDKANHCRNKCIFCFIDQLPKNMRKSLYFKDDDSRLSFLQGNFVTLTNLSDKDIDRIIEYNISPINVSIHTTNPQLRVKMLNNKTAGNILERLNKLTKNRILINGQIVLCPNINDKDELDRTIEDLYPLYPNLHSLAIVPVGVTKYREKLFPLKPFTKQQSIEVIKQIEKWQSFLKQKINTNFVYLSDEFFITADYDLPEYEEYEGFPQIENGVGLIRKFEFEFLSFLKKLPSNLKVKKDVSVITGTSAKKFIEGLAKKLMNKFKELNITVHVIKNEFFGETITVAGLITGQDIIKQLNGKYLGDRVIIPKSMLKSDEDIFLDDISVKELEKRLKTKVLVSQVNGKDFIKKIIE